MEKKIPAILYVVAFLSHGDLASAADFLHSNFCRATSIQISPAGKFIYTNSLDDHALVMETECIRRSGFEACPVYAVPIENHNMPAAFPSGFSFSSDDRYLYYVADVASPEGEPPHSFRPTGTAYFNQVDLASVVAGAPQVTTLDAWINLQKNRYKYLTLFQNAPDPSAANAFYDYAAKVYAKMASVYEDIPIVPYRSVWGEVSKSVYTFLRMDGEYKVYLYTDNLDGKFLSNNGSAFFKSYSSWIDVPDYPEFKLDGHNTIVETSGSLLRITNNSDLYNETMNEPRVSYVEGDDPSVYYGYITNTGIYDKGLTSDAEHNIRLAQKINSSAPLTGLSVNNKTGAIVLSFKRSFNFDPQVAQATYTHLLVNNGAVTDFNCEGEPNFSFKQREIGGHEGIWIDSYIVAPGKKTIVYFHGGPDAIEDVNGPGAAEGFKDFLAAGFNLDIVHYGGSRFTYETRTRLRNLGYKSFERDVKIVNKYVHDSYRAKQADLMLASFGGLFYKYFDAKALNYFDKTVLLVPFGSYVEGKSKAQDDAQRADVGDEIYDGDFETAYFDNLNTCPVVTPTLLVAATNDERANELHDYRSCVNQPALKIYRDGAGHTGFALSSDPVRNRTAAMLGFLLDNGGGDR